MQVLTDKPKRIRANMTLDEMTYANIKFLRAGTGRTKGEVVDAVVEAFIKEQVLDRLCNYDGVHQWDAPHDESPYGFCVKCGVWARR